MTDHAFDTALVTAAFRLAGEQGWGKVNPVEAARSADLPVDQARARFPSRDAILLRFGLLADQAALHDAPATGSVRDRLFDILMRRFDVLQANRAGVRALLRSLPAHPRTAMLLACQSKRSMRWMLQGAGLSANGPRGHIQVRGLLAVWLWAVRAWEKDDSEDLSGTMAAIDSALQRAEQLANWLHRTQPDTAPPPPVAAEGAGSLDPANPPADSVAAASADPLIDALTPPPPAPPSPPADAEPPPQIPPSEA